MSQSSSNLADQVATDLKTEMLQLRKDFEFPMREAAASSDATLRQISASVADLQRQLTSLSEHVRRQPPAAAPMPAFNPPAPTVPSGPPPIPPTTRRESTNQPTNPQMEDVFAAALASQSTQAVLQLINEHAGIMDRCFPTMPGAQPLVSQAVVFTLMHQVS